MKIKTIKIHNYRAFYPQHDENQSPKPYEIAVNGKNVLIYGENGSGKTSLFRAVRDFIASSRTQVLFDLHAFATQNADGSIQDGEISLEFENGDIFKFTNHASLNDAEHNSNISLADKASGWLTYSEILKTYLVDKGKPDLFNLLVEDILKNHLLPPSNGETVKEEWKKLSQNINNDRRKTGKSKLFKNKRELNCDSFNVGFKTLLKGIPKVINGSVSVNDVIGIETILNEWLNKYFNNGLKINFNFQEVKDYYNNEKRINRHELQRSLTLDIELHGRVIFKSDYQNFLNEARLSALAICIFLAAFKTNPTDTLQTKIIYLDDVFIGLDMSNRLPLLEILEKEFITEGYQVFLSTYDKAWFELAKKYLEKDWCHIEMYHSKSDTVPNVEIPVIINPTASNLEKVRQFILICDYPAAANYLRKHIEGLIKERLVEEDVRQFSNKYKTLHILWERLLERYKSAGISLPEDINRGFQISKISILNPLSHDSLSTPVYINELNKAIKIAEDIEQIPIIKTFCFLPKGTLFYYSSPTYSLIFKLNSDWYLKKEAYTINYEDGAKFSYFKWKEKGFRYYNQKTKLPFTSDEINGIIKHDYKLDDVLKALNKHQKLQSTNEDLMKLIHIKSIGNFSKTLNNTLEFLSKNDFLHLFK